MTDDGSGHAINIPSFLINHKTAKAFEKFYREGHRIMLRVELEIKKKDDVPVVDIWFSTPFDLHAAQLRSIADKLSKIETSIQINLHANLKSCLSCPIEE